MRGLYLGTSLCLLAFVVYWVVLPELNMTGLDIIFSGRFW